MKTGTLSFQFLFTVSLRNSSTLHFSFYYGGSAFPSLYADVPEVMMDHIRASLVGPHLLYPIYTYAHMCVCAYTTLYKTEFYIKYKGKYKETRLMFSF